jgi:hypothetical protein
MQGEKLTASEWIGIIGALGAFINIIILSWIAFKKSGKEIKKLEDESQHEIGDAVESVANASKVTVETLMTRITQLDADLTAEKEARKRDIEYLRRRLRDAEQESRDYRSWAAQLARQVIEAGKQPVPFVPSVDTDQGLQSVKKD